MYIIITDVVGKKRINLTYLIWGKEFAIVSMFSDNVQYQIREPFKVLLITNEKRQLLKRTFMGRELSTFIGRKVITTLLDTNKNFIKTNKLAQVTVMVPSLNKLDSTDNLEDKTSATSYLGIM